jgi:signal transduction histidine kinase
LQIQPEYSYQIFQALLQEINLAIFRIIQEALTNISQHSDAKLVIINLKETENFAILQVENNGVGFNPKQNTTGFGLQCMCERSILSNIFFIFVKLKTITTVICN